jgi:2,4-dienoyl-CoA reductase-like NADH-dependent reductase (Old Yellow Enzyme family)
VAQVARMLQDGGIDAIEVSGGTLVSGALGPVRQKISGEETQAYFRYAARHLKTLLQVPVMLVGGIRSPALAERLLSEGVADYFSMSRPFIREPHLIKRWQAGDTRPAACVSDNACNKAARSGEGIYCVVEKKGSGRIT